MTKLINSSVPAAPIIRPEPEQIAPAYAKMLISNETRKLGTVTTQGSPLKRDEITGEITIPAGALTVKIKAKGKDIKNRLEAKDLKVSTHKLLDLCYIELTNINDYRGKDRNLEVVIPLDRYRELLQLPDTKASRDRVRKRVREDLDMLSRIGFIREDPSGKINYYSLCQDYTIDPWKGYFTFTFGQKVAEDLIGGYMTEYPVELLALDERNRAAFYIGNKLSQHYSIRTNQIKGTADIISLNALLRACPVIPSYEEVMETDRHLERRIIQATTDAINSLPFIEDWSYCNAKKVPETEEQRETPITLERLNSLYIHFKLKDHPEEALGEYAISGPSDK